MPAGTAGHTPVRRSIPFKLGLRGASAPAPSGAAVRSLASGRRRPELLSLSRLLTSATAPFCHGDIVESRRPREDGREHAHKK